MTTTKDKYCVICHTINKTDNGWNYWNKLLESYKDDSDYKLLKEKLDKTIKLLNDNESDIINMDVEKELWEII